jgi:flagellar biosynthetic protein FliR
LSEIGIGLSVGLILSILFSAAYVAGEKIASTAGLSMSTMVDPQSGGQTVVLSSVLSLFLISVFLSLDGHLYLIKMILESYVYLPIGLTLNFSEVSQMGINTFGKMLYLAALISLPVVGGLLLIQGAIGVITRSAPSLNLFSFGFPIALISLFIFLYAGVDPISNAFSDITGMSINLIDNLLHSPTKKSF